MIETKRLRIALNVGASHFLLLLVLQAESLLAYLKRPSELGSLLLWQREPLLVALALTVALYFLPRRRPVLLASFAAILALDAYLVWDQIIYKLFSEHFRFSLTEGRIGNLEYLWSSFLAVADLYLFFNIALFIALAWLLRATWLGEKYSSLSPKASWWALTAATALVAVPQAPGDHHHLDRHPLVALLAPHATVRPDVEDMLQGLDRKLFASRTESFSETAESAKAVTEAAARIRDTRKAPNVVLVVLESVGSEQLFSDRGGLSPEITPFLSKLARHALVFPDVYAVFPGTSRAHASLMTGGRHLTWESVYNTFGFDYQGPTFVSELKRRGYVTGLHSAANLEGDNMDTFYKNLGFDSFEHFGMMSGAFRKAHELSGWGGDEDGARAEAMRWVDSVRSEGKPFFLEFLTTSTHHPYVVPRGYQGPFAGKTDKEKHRNALHYIDSALGRLVADLEQRGVLDDTLIAITGDHGEGFGEIHPDALLHRRLYDETMKSFLVIASPRAIQQGPIVSKRIGSSGDILPTVLSLIDDSSADVVGQSLVGPAFRPRLAFFQDASDPEQRGLRDGKWKFVEHVIGDSSPELYDLSTDPNERVNIAGQHPDLVATFHPIASSWYFAANMEFVRRLKGYRPVGNRAFNELDFTSPGPKRTFFGYRDDDSHFLPLDRINPFEHVNAKTFWLSYPETRQIGVQWLTPSGDSIAYAVVVRSEWFETHLPLPAVLPLQTGRWELVLWEGDKRIPAGSFLVDKNAPLARPENALPWASRAPGPKLVFFGHDEPEGFSRSSRLAATEAVTARVRFMPYPASDEPYAFEWQSPSGSRFTHSIVLRSGVTTVSVPLPAALPLEPGTWRFAVKHRGTDTLLSRSFEIVAETRPVARRELASVDMASLVPIAEPPPAEAAGDTRITLGFLDINEDFVPETRVNPRLHVAVRVAWRSPNVAESLHWEWRSPGGKRYSYERGPLAGKSMMLDPLIAPWPLERGRWTLRLTDGKGRTATRELLVDERAPLEASTGFAPVHE